MADAVAGGVHFPPEYESKLSSEPYVSRRSWFGSTEGLNAAMPERMVGANMAFRADAARAVGGFNPLLGAGASGFHEESLFSWQLRERGFRLVSAFDASVEHWFDISRLNNRYLLDHGRRLARSSAFLDAHWPQYKMHVRMESWSRGVIEALRRMRRQPPSIWGRTLMVRKLERSFQMTYSREYERLTSAPGFESAGVATKVDQPPARVSIILSTRNRANDLRETLKSLGDVTIPEDAPTELILIDNGSTDHTAEVVRNCGITNISVRYLYEPRIGKCRALNRGMKAAQGEVFVFTDDDVRFPPEWIECMARPILTGSADAVQGGVRLAPDLVRPWMSNQHRMFLASTADLIPDKLDGFVGANFSVSAEMAGTISGFDVELGPGLLGAGRRRSSHGSSCGWDAASRAGWMFASSIIRSRHASPGRASSGRRSAPAPPLPISNIIGCTSRDRSRGWTSRARPCVWNIGGSGGGASANGPRALKPGRSIRRSVWLT